MNTQNNTPSAITVHYTQYLTQSFRSYYGSRAVTSAVPTKLSLVLGRETEKAFQLINPADNATTWVPKSKFALNEDGSYTVNKGFCHFANWPNWIRPKR